MDATARRSARSFLAAPHTSRRAPDPPRIARAADVASTRGDTAALPPRPRAEWREKCMRGFGNPMTACSYFLVDEYPAFMRFFYAVWVGLSTIMVIVMARCTQLPLPRAAPLTALVPRDTRRHTRRHPIRDARAGGELLLVCARDVLDRQAGQS